MKNYGRIQIAITKILLLFSTEKGGNEETVSAEPSIIKNENSWQYTFDNIERYDSEGRQYTYWVTEETLEGYDTMYSDTDRAYNGGTVTNVEKGALKVSKTVKGNKGEKDRKFEFTVKRWKFNYRN